MKPISVPARYNTTCPYCDRGIHKNDTGVSRVGGIGWVHTETCWAEARDLVATWPKCGAPTTHDRPCRTPVSPLLPDLLCKTHAYLAQLA